MPRQKTSFDKAEVYGYAYSDFNGASISWILRKQWIVALPSCEAEYVVTSYETCQALWIKMLLEELKMIESKKMKLFVDNKSTIDLAKNPMCHGKSKHIERRYHFLIDKVNK